MGTRTKITETGKTWISWSTSLTVIIALMQIQALNSVKTQALSGLEGQTFDFICEYPRGREKNAKYFYRVDDNEPSSHLIRTEKHDEWKNTGRFSMYDNTTGAFFIVRVDKVSSGDSGTYWCGVDVSLLPDVISEVQLNVSPANEVSELTGEQTVHTLSHQLILAAASCLAALMFVCLFSCCLLLAVKRKRRQKTQASSEYETMVPGVKSQTEVCCRCLESDCRDLSVSPPAQTDLRPPFESKYRESAISLGLGDYVDVDTRGRRSLYQHLELSQLEDHIYHGLYGNLSTKIEPVT
ncbi:uncharacterized protein ACNS7B_001793 [Menidia menidia]